MTALPFSLATLSLALNAVSDLSLILDGEAKVLFANDSFAAALGAPPAELSGKAVSEIWPGANADEICREIGLLAQNETGGRVDCVLEDRSRHPRRINWTLTKIAEDNQLHRAGVYLLSGSEGLERARPLQSGEQMFRELLEAAPDAMVLVDGEGKIVLVNSQAETLFGYQREDLLGKTLELLIPERFREDHVKHRKRYAHAPSVRRMGAALELWARRSDGSEFPVEVSLSPLVSGGSQLVMSAIRDTSERREAESRIRSSLHEKEVLLKEVHHRVKNNLQVINSILNLQAEKLQDPDTKHIFNETRSRIRSIALVHERLYKTPDLTNVDFREYLEGLLEDLCRTFDAGGGRINIQTRINYPSLSIDKTISCGLIVNELVSNSLKYAFPCERAGTVSISLEPRQEGMVALTVADDGVGLPASFDYRNTDSLGLKLVIGLSKELGGKLRLENDGGTRVTIDFPVAG